MSRGLGNVQREILGTLEEAELYGNGLCGGSPGYATTRGEIVRLPDRAFDLRASCAYLARQRGPEGWNDGSFRVIFSRAVRGLIKRGLLVPVDFVGLEPLRQVRFVELPKC